MKYNINSQLKIDFVIQCGGRIIPTEVKAEENVKSKSLKTFIQVQYPNLKGLRISMKQYVDQGWMENIPLSMVEPYISHCAES